MTFNDFALRAEILQAVEEAGYTNPTPIQEQAIPAILSGGDLLGIAQTGTGKTAAFVLPMIEHLASGQAKARMPRSLIISPTRELASQTADYFATYGKYVKLSMALLIGGVSLEDQAKKLERGVDVLIATPGRLIDQFERGNLLLGGVTILVIDEGDRMLDMGFIPDVERIVKLLPRRQQTMMFSATMPAEIRRLADAFLTRPHEVQATRPATAAEGVEDHVAIVPPRQKFKALRQLIESQEVGKAIIFCNRKREVASLRRQLERVGMNVRDIHGDLDQAQRTQTLDAFKRGEVDFLVATDVAARGLDIAMLPCVINYDIPIHADDYVHRIGRTGRAGQEGRAFTLVLPDEGRYVDAITKLTGRPIPRLELSGIEGPELAEAEPKRRGRRARTRDDGRSAAPAEAKPEVAAEAPARPARRRRGPAARAEAMDTEAATPATAAEPPDTAAPPAAPEPEASAADEAPPAGRSRRTRRPAKRGRRRTTETAEQVAPAPEAEAEVEAAAPETVEPAGVEAEAKADEPLAPEPRARRQGRARGPAREGKAKDGKAKESRAKEGKEPVVGMGDHVPLFMLRPVPVTPPRRSDEP